MAGGRPTKYNKSGIYALTCPESGEIRYIGQSNNIQRRYNDHCSNMGRCNLKSHYSNWINSLNNKPGLLVLKECTDLDTEEVKQIRHYKKLGYSLVNTGSGGEGYPSEPVYHLSRKMKSMFGVNSKAYKMSRELLEIFKSANEEHKKEITCRCNYLMGN